ncbi:hypothetical protein F190043G2_23810 [Blautia caecimuris]
MIPNMPELMCRFRIVEPIWKLLKCGWIFRNRIEVKLKTRINFLVSCKVKRIFYQTAIYVLTEFQKAAVSRMC